MKFGLAATTVFSTGSAAIVAAEHVTRRRGRVHADELTKGHLKEQEESKTGVDANFKQHRAGSKKKTDIGSAGLGVLHPDNGRHMRAEAAAMSMLSEEIDNTAMSMLSEIDIPEGGRPGKPGPKPDAGNDVDGSGEHVPSPGVKILTVAADKLGIDVEGACEEVYDIAGLDEPAHSSSAKIPGAKILTVMDKLGFDVEGTCYEYLCPIVQCETSGDDVCDGVSQDSYCLGGYCCNKIAFGGTPAAPCERDCDCCNRGFNDYCGADGYCTY